MPNYIVLIGHLLLAITVVTGAVVYTCGAAYAVLRVLKFLVRR